MPDSMPILDKGLRRELYRPGYAALHRRPDGFALRVQGELSNFWPLAR